MALEFSAEMAEFSKKAGKAIEETATAIVTNLFSSVIQSTPVGNPTIWKDQQHADWAVANGYTGGRARANWQFSIRIPADGEIDVQGPAAESKSALLIGALPSLCEPGEVHYLTNNLPYINRLEYDGWSKQSPEGMVRKNMVRLRVNLDAIIRENAL